MVNSIVVGFLVPSLCLAQGYKVMSPLCRWRDGPLRGLQTPAPRLRVSFSFLEEGARGGGDTTVSSTQTLSFPQRGSAIYIKGCNGSE